MFKFTSANIETAVESERAVVNLVSDTFPTYIQATLTLHEDEAVELATLLLAQAQKLRAERLSAHGLAYPYSG